MNEAKSPQNRDCMKITGDESYISLSEKARPSVALLIFYLEPSLGNISKYSTQLVQLVLLLRTKKV